MEQIIQTHTTFLNTLLRVRALGFSEQLMSGSKFIIEQLSGGTFKKAKHPYYKSEAEALQEIKKIAFLDELNRKRQRAIPLIKEGFEESIKGSPEYDFYQIQGCLCLNDCDFKERGSMIALCSIDSCDTKYVNEFLRKYNYPTTYKHIYVEDHSDCYNVILQGYDNKAYCLLETHPLQYDLPGGKQYRFLFESYLNINYSRFI